MEKLIPHNIEAEQGVLGSILIDPQALDRIADQLRAEDFYRDGHRLMYESIMRLVATGGQADYLTLCDDLERYNKLEAVGGAVYITSLINVVPTSGNIEYYADIVARAAEHRRLIHAAGQIAALGYGQDEGALQKSEQLLFDLQKHTQAGDFVPMSTRISEYLCHLDKLHEYRGQLVGVTSGFHDIDFMTGGWQRSDLIILAGRPSSGKTSLGLSMAYHAALEGSKVAVFSLEMSGQQLTTRLVAMDTGIPLHLLRSGWIEDEQWEHVTASATRIAGLPLWINDVAANPLTSMRSQLRRLIQQHGTVDFVMVDYLGLVGPGDAKYENRVQEVNKISKGLKQLAREFDVPVLSLAQLSRKVEDRQDKRPQLADLRDSGSIEEDSDLVMFIYREDYYNKSDDLAPEKKNITEICIAKHRNGPTTSEPIQLYFDQKLTRFYDLERKLQQDQ